MAAAGLEHLLAEEVVKDLLAEDLLDDLLAQGLDLLLHHHVQLPGLGTPQAGQLVQQVLLHPALRQGGVPGQLVQQVLAGDLDGETQTEPS